MGMSCILQSADLVPSVTRQVVPQNLCREKDVEIAADGVATESVYRVRQSRHVLPGREGGTEDFSAVQISATATPSSGHNQRLHSSGVR